MSFSLFTPTTPFARLSLSLVAAFQFETRVVTSLVLHQTLPALALSVCLV